MKTLIVLALGIGLLGVSIPASAHHGFAAEYDRTKQLTLVGKLSKVEMENPHGWLYIDAKDSEGKVVTWALELPGPAALRRSGADLQSLVGSGEVVTVTASAARDGSKHAFGISLTRADGQTVVSLGRLPQQGGGFGRGPAPGQGQNPQGPQTF
jgi:hypothetical protein